MSYNCSVIFNFEKIDDSYKKDLLEMFKKEGILTDINLGDIISGFELSFSDDPSEIISKWIEKNKLTLEVEFIPEDEDLDELLYDIYVDGARL